MIAKFRINSKIYYSVVFAVQYKGWSSKIIAFDETYTRLVVIDYWSKKGINIIFTDYSHDDWEINTDNFKSYWDINNIFSIVKKQKYSKEMLEEAKKIQSRIVCDKFISLSNSNDIEALTSSSLEFHDSYTVKLEAKDDNLKILFNTTWGSYIYLECEGVTQNNLRVGDDFFNCDITKKDIKYI
jgi:hypothetical protein